MTKMGLNQIENVIWFTTLGCVTIFFTVLSIRCFKHSNQLRKAFLELGMAWPLPSSSEMNEELKLNFFGAMAKVYSAPFKFTKIIFFMRTDNPALIQPIRGIRRCLLALPLFAVLLALILLVIYVILDKLRIS
jgi:hypothetical protein